MRDKQKLGQSRVSRMSQCDYLSASCGILIRRRGDSAKRLRQLGFHQNKLDVENEVGQDEDGAKAEDQTEGETGSQKNGFLQWLTRCRQGNASKRELKEEISMIY